MKIALEEIRKKASPVNQYLANINEPFRQRFLERKKAYQLDVKAINKLKSFANNYVIVAFSAEWCKDCAANIPVLALISESTGLEVRIFGGLKKDPLSPNRRWSIPPSPPEVERFQVDKIPLILIFSKEGTEKGRIVENPRVGLTLEEEILRIIQGNAEKL